LLWSLRQVRLAYPLTAALHKLGLLRRLGEVNEPSLLSLLGNLTVQVAEKPGRSTLGLPDERQVP